MGANQPGVGKAEFMNERDILYKLFFDLKKDVTEMKKMFFEMVQNPSMASSVSQMVEDNYRQEIPFSGRPMHDNASHNNILPVHSSQPVILSDNRDLEESIVVDESLNIMDKEKELIEKALKKHKGKRKDAASDLGISERTLYRKLKEYDIED